MLYEVITMHWKEQLGNWYGMFLHESQYLEPSMRNIEAFLESTQKNVNGKVILKLKEYRFEIVGIESDNNLMSSKFGEYGEMNKLWDARDVEGFTTILATPLKIYNAVNKDELDF